MVLVVAVGEGAGEEVVAGEIVAGVVAGVLRYPNLWQSLF